MTTIAWDGKTLAGDRLCTDGRTKSERRKVMQYALRAELIAYAGRVDVGDEMVQWYLFDVSRREAFPAGQRDDNTSVTLIVVERSGDIIEYGITPCPIRHSKPQFYAIGSGREYAMAAMHCGKTAAEAVEIAAVYDLYTGGGVDVVTHD